MTALFHYATFKKEENHSNDYDRLRNKYISSLNKLFGETWKSIKNLE